jgi:hypothetical protein
MASAVTPASQQIDEHPCKDVHWREVLEHWSQVLRLPIAQQGDHALDHVLFVLVLQMFSPFYHGIDLFDRPWHVSLVSEFGNVFGGFTEQSWSGNDAWKADDNSFIFSLINKDNRPLKLKCPDPTKAIWCSSNYGPIFGQGPAIRIHDNSNQNTESISWLGLTAGVYKHPYYAEDSQEAESFLAGSDKFKVSEIETFMLD